MVRWHRLGSVALVTSALACGGAGAADSGTAGTSLTSLSETGIESGNSAEGNSAEGNSTSADTGDGDGDSADGASGDGDGDSGDGDADSSGGVKWDLGTLPDASHNCSDTNGGNEEFSYIWICSSSEGSVSKINTVTLVEEGRYYTRDTFGNPSRTSVSLSGNVAVANRSGGVIKIFSNTEDCDEMKNGQPGLQTSMGANDLLPFGQDDCLAWYTPFPYSTQRPVAWSAGDFNEGTCTYDDAKVWSAGGMGNAEVVLMNGDTGVVEETVIIPNVVGWAGLYGGAVDPDGNFWTVDHNWTPDGSTLVRVNGQDFTYDTWHVQQEVHYGLAVDVEGRAWLCGSGGFSRFDPQSETWQHVAPINPGSALGGCMEDANGVIWNSAYPNAVLVGLDTNTMQVVQMINIPEYVHGVSIDFQGNIWGVAFGGSNAYRVDPETLQIDMVGGLVGAYTYSDMTGFALSQAAGNPTG